MNLCRVHSGILGSCRRALHSLPSPLIVAHRHASTEVQKSTDINQALSRSSSLFKTYKPVTPSLRHLKRPINDHLYEGKPIRLLTVPLRKKGGRNSQGRITVRFRGGGHKQRIRLVDFKRTDPGPQDVIRIEYDPGRSAHIALVRSRDELGNKGMRFSYILAPDGLRAGDVVESFSNGIPDGLVPGYVDVKKGRKPLGSDTNTSTASTEESKFSDSVEQSGASLALGMLRALTVKPGNVLPLRLIPPGTAIHCISLLPGGKAILVRSAGTSALVMGHDESGRYSHVKLQSGEVRKVLQECCATIGSVSNSLWRNRNLGKAGRNRWLGRRPHVRGVAMNRQGFAAFTEKHLFTDLLYSESTILMEVVEASPKVTSIQGHPGVG